jgi:hypothetical protein
MCYSYAHHCVVILALSLTGWLAACPEGVRGFFRYRQTNSGIVPLLATTASFQILLN